MNRILFLHCVKSFRSAKFSMYPLIVGKIEDNYLPTNFERREKTVTIFGGTGYLGEYLISALVKHKYQIILPYRCDVHDFKHLRMIGGVGQNLFMPFSVDDENSIEKAVENSNAVINLIGRSYETHDASFKYVHVDIARRIARISRKKNVECFIQMSALGAAENPKSHILPSGSQFLKSRFQGEIEVTEEFPGAVIIRPSNIWGKNDDFIFYYLHRKRRLRGTRTLNIPLWRLGQETVKQPIYVGDLAEAISLVLFKERYRGSVIECVGPDRYQLDHLVKWFYLNMRYPLEKIVFSEFTDWFLFKARWSHWKSVNVPHLTDDLLERECVTDQLTSGLTLGDLGIRPCRLEDRLQWITRPYHCLGYRWDEMGGFPPPPSPPIAAY